MGMPKKMILLVAVLLAATVSCSRRPRVIPVGKMEKIYREMFLADQWLADFPEKKAVADTSWFYAPIFGRYGYDVEDYRKSVDYYLSDPKRYAELMGRVVKDLQNESERISVMLERRQKMKFRADSLASALKAFSPEDFVYYGDFFLVSSMTDRVDIRRNPRGAYFPVPVIEDTIFRGPELIIRDSVAEITVPGPVVIPWKE